MYFLKGQLPVYFSSYPLGHTHRQQFISLIDPGAKLQCFPGTPENISVVPFRLRGITGGIVEGSQLPFGVTIGTIFTGTLSAMVAPLTLPFLVKSADAHTCYQGQW